MSVFRDMAIDAGYHGDEARHVAALLEQEEMERAYRQQMTPEEECYRRSGHDPAYPDAAGLRLTCWCGCVTRRITGETLPC